MRRTITRLIPPAALASALLVALPGLAAETARYQVTFDAT